MSASHRIGSALGGVLLVSLALSPAVGAPAGAEPEVTLRYVGAPLEEVAGGLSVDGERLTVESRLRELKAVVLVHSRPRREVLSSLEVVFGAKWVRLPDGSLELRRRQDVIRWERDWRNTRARALEEARFRIAAMARRNLDTVIARARKAPSLSEDANSTPPDGVINVSLTRFLGTLPSRDLDLLSHHAAALSPVHPGGDESLEERSPLSYAFRDLSRTQQEHLRDYVREHDLRQIEAGLQDSIVGFRIGRLIRLDLRLANGQRCGDYLIGMYPGAVITERFIQEATLRHMSTRSTPAGALLGTELKPTTKTDYYGEKYTAVAFDPPSLLTGDDPPFLAARLAPPSLLYQQWTTLTHERVRFDLVSDYHTQPLRLDLRMLTSPAEFRLSHVLAAGAGAYQRVFRADKGLILSRSAYWPDRDQEEVPRALASRWRNLLRDNGYLPFEDLVAISRLPEAQQNGLAAYDDGEARFHRVFQLLRTRRRLFAALRELSTAQWRLIRSPAGLTIASIPSAPRAALVEDLLKQAESRGEALPQGWERSYLRLYSMTRGEALYAFVHPEKQPFWEAGP